MTSDQGGSHEKRPIGKGVMKYKNNYFRVTSRLQVDRWDITMLDVMEEAISHTKQVFYPDTGSSNFRGYIKFRRSFNMVGSLSLQKGAATSSVNSGPPTGRRSGKFAKKQI